MGITGLLPYLKKASRTTNISEYKGCTAAIDSYCWLHKGAFSCAEKLALGEETDQYVYYCMKLVNMLLSFDIKPVMVFDGCRLPSKADTEKQRRERRQTNKKKAAQFLREGRRAEARQCLQMSIDVTPKMALRLMEACREKGVDCIVAPYEADAQLAYLAQIGIAQLIITEDSDLVLFGCDRILYKMDANGDGVLVEKSKLNLALGLQADMYSFEKFRYMCILSGCDYLPSLPGIGLVKANKVFKLTRNPDIEIVVKKLPTTLKMSNLTVPQEYVQNFIRANNTVLYQLVYDPLARKLRPLHSYPSDVDPKEMTYAGPHISDGRAYQIALGNICIYSGDKIADFDPDTFKPRSKKKSKSSGMLHMKSIWDPGYRPMPKISHPDGAKPKSSVVERSSTKNKEVTVHYRMSKKSPVKRSRQEDFAAEEEERKKMLMSYAVDKSPGKKRRRVELQQIFQENGETDDAVNILASLEQPEHDVQHETSVPEESKENSPKKSGLVEGKTIKSPPNKFAVKSRPNKDVFDLNAKKTVTDVKSRFFTQSKPLKKTNFFDLLGDHQIDQTAPSLPPDTNEEDDQMNDKDISYNLSFGLDSVLRRAEEKSLKESETGDPGSKSPFGSFPSKLSSFKSGFDRSTLTTSAKSRNQFKPVKVKQVTLESFERSVQQKPIPNTNFFDEECECKLKVEKRPPSLPPDTHEEDDQMEMKSLWQSRRCSGLSTEEPALPNLTLDIDINCSVDNDSYSLSESSVISNYASQSLVTSESCSQKTDLNCSVGDNTTSTAEGKAQSRTLKKSNSIISMFKRSQQKEKRSPLYKQRTSGEFNSKEALGVIVNLTDEDPSQSIETDTVLQRTAETPTLGKTGPCRRFGLSKSSSKKKSPASSKDKKKQPKLTESLSVYFFNKKVNKIPSGNTSSGTEYPDGTPETSSSLTRQESHAVQRKLSLH